MGSFANSALNFMLGWVRSAAQWLWGLINGQQGSAALEWLGKHWMQTAIALCVAGIVIDFMVYLARWRPDLVWRSFIRRLKKGSAQQPAMEEQVQQAVPASEAEAAPAAQPEQPGRRERHRRADRYGEGTPYAHMKKVKDLIFYEEQPVTFQAYKPAKPLANQDEAKEPGKPYIPPQWQKPEE